MNIEKIAFDEFEKVGDDGLFPNHTDKDIWIAGFKAGYLYSHEKKCTKSPDGNHEWILPPNEFESPYCKFCYK